MTRSDIGVIGIVYAVCLIFLYMTMQLVAAARIYPLCLIAGLALLNTLYLLKRLAEYFKSGAGRRIINDLPEIFKGFMPPQFLFVLAACFLYIPLMRWLGFYLAGLIYMVIVMLFLKARKLQICAAVVLLGALVYGVFTALLNVPLPQGLLFS